MKETLLVIFTAASLLVHPLGVAAQDKLCSIAAPAIAAASSIRGLKQKGSVPCLMHGKEEVKNYLLTTLETKIPKEKFKGEEELLKGLGFIPAEFDYKQGIVELYLSQLGGYYDPDKKHYVMAAWLPAAFQTPIAVHELTHALQDQYYDLGKMVHALDVPNDTLLARSALVEGDATAVMMDYSRRIAGQSSLREEKNVQGIMMQNVIGGAMVVGAAVPEPLQLMLLFPYTSGIRFAHKLIQQGGYRAIDQAFKRPPQTTEEILHPEKYISQMKDEYRTVSSAEVLFDGATESYHDVVGEFVTVLLLAHLTGDKLGAADAAAGWGGDRASIVSREDRRWVVWRSVWDSEKDCKEFFEMFTQGLAKRYGDAIRRASVLEPAAVDLPTIARSEREVLYIAPLELAGSVKIAAK
ncbi:MAG: hypothetical protein QY326_03940 [Bdellovibrionota bacterium]|nr:MAG: hypothetical protein QY326_03940 [Bdellovibrionota bacterium]